MVVSTSACHDQDNTFTPGSSVWNKGVDGGVGDGVLCLRRFCHHSHVVIRFKTCSIAINTKNIVKIMIKEWQLNLVHQLCVVGHASVLKPENNQINTLSNFEWPVSFNFFGQRFHWKCRQPVSPEDFTWQVGSADLGKKDFFSSNFVLGLVSTEYSSIHNLHLILFIYLSIGPIIQPHTWTVFPVSGVVPSIVRTIFKKKVVGCRLAKQKSLLVDQGASLPIVGAHVHIHTC